MIEQVIQDALRELESSRERYPSNDDRYSVLTEEIMELYQAWQDRSESKKTDKEIYLEGVQVLAMLLRLLIEGDSKYKFKGLIGGDLMK